MNDELDVPLLVDTSAASESDDESLPAVPITIVTGYLGSGKSTLLNYLTKENHGKKIAIILNEFGDSADIERSLTVSENNTEVQEWLELNNGCLCCTVKDAGVTAIETLMKRRGRFDYILLETTGIADPAPIANMFWLDKALSSSVELDSVVTVVDAVNIAKSLETGSTAQVQIACADIVVINKCDLVTPEQLQTAKEAVSSVNAACKILETSFGRIDPSDLLEVKAYSKIDFDSIKPVAAKHDKDISTITIALNIKDQKHYELIESQLQHLLWEREVAGNPVEIHRAKGRLSFGGKTKILQAVRETYELTDVPFEESDSKIVLIGRGFDKSSESIEALFAPECLKRKINHLGS
ncbi:COBW domain-containing protein 1 [Wickerhamiella sorbophila]|uniref:COBW domain-containing protein 1 n=1 Tax=Wickerhamiella sorbophila TaxID=45607 RepID=A0A2T0FN13_9ASCO|nr:COBW domain-containing protein 1 [Wickerhamiella sorbophila]PRT56365.1 COBW domain-containing protein 1 [Wickerhamiella sorbophila]